MKNKEYYHTSADCYDVKPKEFDISSNNKIEVKRNVKLFNLSNDVNEKTEYAKLFIDIFPKCRICGRPIINRNSSVGINKLGDKIKVLIPNVDYRVIDDVKHRISCCYECCCKHFTDNPPHSEKYVYMKASIYGQYCFNYSNDEYKRICSMTTGVTEESMIKKWGKEEGKKRWEEYKIRQAETNEFEYKQKKLNWTKEDFDEYNKSRAVTLENLIIRHGEEEGKKRWDAYVEVQKKTKSYEYMVDKFGADGAKTINASKGLTLANFTRVYGAEEGLKRYEEYLSKHGQYYSNISQVFFNALDDLIGNKFTTYYATKNQEYGLCLSKEKYVKLDYFILEKKLCIEFNGSLFHADPRIYKADDHPNFYDKEKTAKEIWKDDQERYRLLKEVHNIDTVVVWENDYREGIDINKFIKETLKIEI